MACLVSEIVLAFMFLMIILGATDRRAPQGFSPIAIGLGLTLIHLIGIPVTNLSVNPARSTGPALVCRGVGPGATLALLDRTHSWSCLGRRGLSGDRRGTSVEV
jgi:aquaporin Z